MSKATGEDIYWGSKWFVEYEQLGYIAKLTVFGVSVYQRVGRYFWLLGFSWEGTQDDWFNEFIGCSSMSEEQKEFLRQYNTYRGFYDAFAKHVGEEYAYSIYLVTLPEALAELMKKP
jgi:hypothetical protein